MVYCPCSSTVTNCIDCVIGDDTNRTVKHVVFIGERDVITERMYVITSRHLSIRNPSFFLSSIEVCTDQVFDRRTYFGSVEEFIRKSSFAPLVLTNPILFDLMDIYLILLYIGTMPYILGHI